MQITRLIGLTVLAGGLALIAAVAGGTVLVVKPRLEALEATDVEEHVRGVLRALEVQKQEMARLAFQYGAWTEAANFIDYNDRSFQEDELCECDLDESSLSLIRYFDRDGWRRAAAVSDAALGMTGLPDERLVEASSFWNGTGVGKPRTSFAATNKGLAVVAVEAVRRANATRKSGDVMLVRLLNRDALSTIETLTDTEVSFLSNTDLQRAHYASISQGKRVTLSARNEIVVLEPLRGAGGEVVGAVSVAMPREVNSFGIAALRDMVVLAVLSIVLITTGTAYFLRRRLALPLVRLGKAVRFASDTGHFDPGVIAQRGDEIGGLARAFDSLHDELKSQADDLRLARERSDAANQAKSDFLATMSHEIRTPMNGVLGMAHALAGTNPTRRQKDMLNIILRSGESLLALLNDILDLAKVEAGKITLEQVPFDMADLALGAQSLFTLKAHEKGLSFACNITPAADRSFHGDPTRIRQVLYNLVSNAVKFTEKGEVRVSVDATTEDDGASRLWIRVSDTGIGLSQEQRDRLFQRFSQADSSTTRKYGGTGLGLALCKGLAEAMGGSIGVESAPGAGSTFWFTVRVEPCADVHVEAKTTQPDDAAEENDLSTLRVLAAEDNPVNQLVLRTLLTQFGISVDIVGNGREAVDAWRGNTWDLVLMDVQMPVLDGPSAAREIRDIEKAEGRARTPIIALTANAMVDQITEYLEAGMDGHVAKPIRPDELFREILSAVATREAGEQAVA